MIKFFRKIRQQLLSENKFSKYLLYAIGEIVLVVIGIMIALKINNWNNDLANQKNEKEIVKNLNLEFEQNKIMLQESKMHHEALLAAAKTVMNLIGEPEATLEAYNIDSLLSQSLDYIIYKPSQAVYSDLISSGKLNLISSDSLRILLFEWSSNLEQITEAYNTLDEVSQTLLLPYLTKNASMKNIDRFSIVNWEEQSKLQTNYHSMFQDLEFENNMENQVWDLTNYLNFHERLEKNIHRIIEETKVP
ncbi:DUF6090 family protein [Flagellimonas sp. GZD32]|uniref:DUF6090 family protein n=1 Tax=Flagellimonas cixiensis TaxID=3228750 RepID=UPI0035C91F1B